MASRTLKEIIKSGAAILVMEDGLLVTWDTRRDFQVWEEDGASDWWFTIDSFASAYADDFQEAKELARDWLEDRRLGLR